MLTTNCSGALKDVRAYELLNGVSVMLLVSGSRALNSKNLITMDCKCNKEKHSYHFNITEVVDGKIQEVMNFNFGGHYDLAALANMAEQKENLKPKHAQQLVLGIRLLHHALKKYPDKPEFAKFLGQLNEFKHVLKGDCDK